MPPFQRLRRQRQAVTGDGGAPASGPQPAPKPRPGVRATGTRFFPGAVSSVLLPRGPGLYPTDLLGIDGFLYFKPFPRFVNVVIELILIFLLVHYTAKASSSGTEPEASFLKIITFVTVAINQ